MLVLIVDDNSELRNFLCLSLGEANVQAIGLGSAAGAETIAQRVENEDFDVVAIASTLNGSDGIALTQTLRNGDKGRAIPIILMSNLATTLARRMATNAGCTEFLVRPFSLNRFVEVLRLLT